MNQRSQYLLLLVLVWHCLTATATALLSTAAAASAVVATRRPQRIGFLGIPAIPRGGSIDKRLIPNADSDDNNVHPQDRMQQQAPEIMPEVQQQQPTITMPATTVKSSASSSSSSQFRSLSAAVAFPVAADFALARSYKASLLRRPILTKSATAGLIFALSDILGQRLEKKQDADAKDSSSGEGKRCSAALNKTRTLMSAAVGFLYFGPAAHYWYEMIFKLLPSTSLASTLQKAALGQLVFGPTFTCIFFAASLLQTGTFSLSNWFRKIKADLPGVWLSGTGFWPIVDVISFSLIAPQ
jgi:protein Mpv17